MRNGSRILLLGANGFVGHNLADYLTDQLGYAVKKPSHAELDILDEKAVFNYLKKSEYDVVINCLDRNMTADPVYAEQRLRMYYNLAMHSDLYGKMIWFGSGAEYGRQRPLVKITEQEFGRCIPADSYGFALFQMSLHTLASDNIYNFRLFGIFGKYENWQKRFISNGICKALLGYPLTIRQNRIMDYLDVKDLSKIVGWGINNKIPEHAYNITSGKSYSLLDLAHQILERTNKSLPVYIAREGLFPEYTANNSLIVKTMEGFHFREMAESIDDLINYYSSFIEKIDKEKLLYQ